MFKSPRAQWESILTKPLQKQSKFLNKVCRVNKRDCLLIREAFFENLSFALVKEIFKLVENVSKNDGFDISFKQLILDRLLWVTKVEHLYPDEHEDLDALGDQGNLISGEAYQVYSASYDDLDLIIEFINGHPDIKNLCDLGSGSGRALLYLALKLEREMEYVGLELLDERVVFTNSIAKHFNLNNVLFKTCNFLNNPEDFLGFDIYYLYDPVGTDDVDLLVSYFEKMIADGAKFYIAFISGWDEIMLNALDGLKSLEKLDTNNSRKQEGRFVNFYKVI